MSDLFSLYLLFGLSHLPLFYLGFTARQDYFTHSQPNQSLGGAKTGYPREKTPDNPQAERLVSHVTRARLEPTAARICHF